MLRFFFFFLPLEDDFFFAHLIQGFLASDASWPHGSCGVRSGTPFLWHVNQYIHRKRMSMFPKNDGAGRGGIRSADWLWRNRPFVELVEWMRKKGGCYLFGMDCYSLCLLYTSDAADD